jgi:hypothetical protein
VEEAGLVEGFDPAGAFVGADAGDAIRGAGLQSSVGEGGEVIGEHQPPVGSARRQGSRLARSFLAKQSPNGCPLVDPLSAHAPAPRFPIGTMTIVFEKGKA